MKVVIALLALVLAVQAQQAYVSRYYSASDCNAASEVPPTTNFVSGTCLSDPTVPNQSATITFFNVSHFTLGGYLTTNCSGTAQINTQLGNCRCIPATGSTPSRYFTITANFTGGRCALGASVAPTLALVAAFLMAALFM